MNGFASFSRFCVNCECMNLQLFHFHVFHPGGSGCLQAAAYDTQLGRTSGLEMLTQWIVVTPRSTPFLDRVQEAAHGFDNVVVMSETAVKLTSTTDTLQDNVRVYL